MNRQDYISFRKQLNFKTPRYILTLHILQDMLLLATCSYLILRYPETWQRFLSIPLISIFMFRNFSLMHEAVHGSISKNKTLNHFVGVIAGGACLLPYDPWKHIHLEHHLWSGNVDKDPVMGLMRTLPQWPKPLKIIAGWSWKMWVPVLATFQYIIFWWHSTIEAFKNPSSSKNLISVTFPMFLWGSLFFILPKSVSVSLIIPSVVLYLLAVEVVNFPHHIGLPQYRGDTKIPIWNQYLIARSCVYPKWLARFVALNFNYHIEHHMFPDLPWYHLDKMHRLLSVELNENYNTDAQFEWILQNRGKTLEDLLLTPAQAPWTSHKTA